MIRGEEVRVRLFNDTTEPAAIHWHGVRLPNGADGILGLTQPAIAPGGAFDYRFVAPDAGTFWYRPALASTGQRLRGPSGPLIVSETPPLDIDREAVVFVNALPNAGTTERLSVQTNQRLRFRIINAMLAPIRDRKSTRLNSSHSQQSRMPSSA